MEELVVYAIIQALMAAKAAWFAKMRQDGKTEEEIKQAWRDKWEIYKLEDPTSLPRPR